MVESLYSKLHRPTVIAGQHMVENFSGEELDQRWNFTNIAGSGSVAMKDGVDDGVEITTGTATSNRSEIDYGSIRHYNFDDAIMIAVGRRAATNAVWFMGMLDGVNLGTGTNDRISLDDDTRGTFKTLQCSDGSNTFVVTAFVVDALLTNYRVEITGGTTSAGASPTISKVNPLAFASTFNVVKSTSSPYICIVSLSTKDQLTPVILNLLIPLTRASLIVTLLPSKSTIFPILTIMCYISPCNDSL